MRKINRVYLQNYYYDYYTANWFASKYGVEVILPTRNFVKQLKFTLCTVKVNMVPMFWLILEWVGMVDIPRPYEIFINESLTWLELITTQPIAFWRNSYASNDSVTTSQSTELDISSTQIRYMGTTTYQGVTSTIALVILFNQWLVNLRSITDLKPNPVDSCPFSTIPYDLIKSILTDLCYLNTSSAVGFRLTPLLKYSFFLKYFTNDDEFLKLQRLFEKEFADVELVIQLSIINLDRRGQKFFLQLIINNILHFH